MLAALLSWLFDPSGLTPHGFCLLWNPGLIWIHAVSDLAIGLAYFSIPAAVALVVRRRQDLMFKPVYVLFAGFILLCGAGHWLALLTLWVPVYGIEGIVKAATALVSVVTAAAVWRLLPRIMSLPSPAQMRRVNASLQEANAQLTMAEHVASVGHWRLTLPDRIMHCSDQAIRVFGLPLADTRPHLSDILDLYHPEDRHAVELRFQDAIVSGGGTAMLSRIVRPDGETRHVQIRAVPQWDSAGHLAALFGVVMDKTELQRAEAARAEVQKLNLRAEAAMEASAAKSRFLASMSHELRTPLNGVLGYAQLLRMGGRLTDTQSSQVDAMIGAGGHLLQIINRVLVLSEIEADHVSLELADLDPRALLGLCLELVRPAADKKQLALSLLVSDGVPRLIRADAVRLRQVVLNLAGNAVKFTERGRVVITLAPLPNNRLRLEVADTGPGISAAQKQLLFQEFERLDAGNTQAAEGAGLGLAISARLVSLMGGALGHEDNPGGGSIFWVELPLTQASDAPAPAKAASAPANGTPAPRPLRVLVVDDVAMNRDISRAFLEASGHSVTLADSGATAIALLKSQTFDVILMDVRVPVLSGLDTTRQIRAMAGPNANTPIVALTAQAFTTQMEECRLAGMVGHLTKPFTPETLAKALSDAVKTRDVPANAS